MNRTLLSLAFAVGLGRFCLVDVDGGPLQPDRPYA